MKIEDLPGWFDWPDLYDREAARLATASAHRPVTAVEVGVWLGKSIARLATRKRESRLTTEFGVRRHPFRVVGVDHCVGSEGIEDQVDAIGCNTAGALFSNLQEAGLIRDIDLILADSALAADYFENGSVDFVFIDAAHDYDSVMRDLRAWHPKLRHDGVIAGHDWAFDGVHRAVRDYFRRSDEDLTCKLAPTCWEVS